MPAPTCPCVAPVRPVASAVWNARIREHCAGRTVWDASALIELARLRAGWQAAVAREADLAA